MNSDILTELLKLAIPAAVTALVATVVREIVKLIYARRKRTEAQPGTSIVLPPGVQLPPRAQGLRGSAARRLRRAVDRAWNLMYHLPPLKWRASPWKATLSGLLVGFGVAGYFRTRADVLVGLLLTIPVFVAVAVSPETRAESESQSSDFSGPWWAYVLTYTSMSLAGIYSYLRAVSSNRHLDGLVRTEIGSRSAAERKQVLAHEVQMLVARGWRVESVGEFDAVVSHLQRPNHALHLILTLATLGFWGLVWIALAASSRHIREREFRRIAVDMWGYCTVEEHELPLSNAHADASR
jgi:hypothetical protein